MRRIPVLALAAVFVLATAACGDDADPVATGADPSTAVISISTGGAFSPAGTDFSSVPTLVMGDGTVYTSGPMTMQYPGPALIPVVTGKLAAADLDRLLAAASSAGLEHDDVDYGQPGITDVGSTTITVEIGGTEHTTSVYALGYEDQAGGVTDAQRAARSKVQAFVSEVADQTSRAATTAFEATAFQVQANQSEPASAYTEEPRPNELAWPFPDLPLTSEGCLDLTGARATTFATTLESATAITIWTDAAGSPWHVAVRATLPGDAPCP
jgi:hypothetical protein